MLHATTAAYPGLSARLQVHGDKGSLVIDNDQLSFIHVTPPGSAGEEKAYGSLGGSTNQLADHLPATGTGAGTGSDPAALNPGDPCRGQPAGQQRVLGEGLEATPAQGTALDVDRRAEDDVHRLPLGLRRDESTDPIHQVRIPTGPQGGAARGAQGWRSLVPDRAAHAVRAVGQPQRVHPQRRVVPGGPHVQPGRQRGAGGQTLKLIRIGHRCRSARASRLRRPDAGPAP